MTDPITPEHLDELDALSEAATEGPWTIEPHGKGDAIYSGRLPNLHGLNIANVEEWDWNATANKAFIAAARQAVPRLVKALREALEEAESQRRSRDSHMAIEHLIVARAEEAEAERDALRKYITATAPSKSEAKRVISMCGGLDTSPETR